jgi:hypothetical protein
VDGALGDQLEDAVGRQLGVASDRPRLPPGPRWALRISSGRLPASSRRHDLLAAPPLGLAIGDRRLSRAVSSEARTCPLADVIALLTRRRRCARSRRRRAGPAGCPRCRTGPDSPLPHPCCAPAGARSRQPRPPPRPRQRPNGFSSSWRESVLSGWTVNEPRNAGGDAPAGLSASQGNPGVTLAPVPGLKRCGERSRTGRRPVRGAGKEAAGSLLAHRACLTGCRAGRHAEDLRGAAIPEGRCRPSLQP